MPDDIALTPTSSDPATSNLVNEIFTSTENIVQSQMPQSSEVPQGVIPENQNYVPNDPTPSPTPVEDENPEPENENPNPDEDGKRMTRRKRRGM